MKINSKILLPVFVMIFVILGCFGYLLFYLNKISDEARVQGNKFRELTILSRQLQKEQETTEYNILSYIFTQRPGVLAAIEKSETNKENTILEMYKIVSTEEERQLIDKYVQARKNINIVRTNLLNAILVSDFQNINQKYNIWNQQTDKIRGAISDIEEYSIRSLNPAITSLQLLERRVFEIILALVCAIVFLILTFFYYLKTSITFPLIALSKHTDEFANKQNPEVANNFNAQSLRRKDEIGILYRAFTNMTKILSESHRLLERKIQERTSELTSKTIDLEKSKKEALQLVDVLNKERHELLERKATDSAILSSIGDALCVIDTNGDITYVNQSFSDLTGWTEDESLGKHFTDLIPSETEKGVKIKDEERFISKIVSGENPENDYSHTVYYIRKDMSRFPVSSLVKRILADGKMIGAVKTFTDVTKLKNIDKAKTEFVSLAAHQLRTPISAISWYTEMLLSGDAGEITDTHKKYLNQIYEANQRMINMVKSFLNASRIEMGTMQIEKQDIDVCDLLRDVIDEQKQKIVTKSINFEFECKKSEYKIHTDKDKLRMVFQNLLSNAIKYTDEKGFIKVEVNARDKSNKLVIIFVDTGCGIPDTEKDKIFTKLFRATNALEKAVDGSGLGLYIVKNLIENMGGKIWFESKENQGTTFFLEFPL